MFKDWLYNAKLVSEENKTAENYINSTETAVSEERHDDIENWTDNNKLKVKTETTPLPTTETSNLNTGSFTVKIMIVIIMQSQNLTAH